jgi:hypothetical protein
VEGKVAVEEHFVTPELEDLVLHPGWSPEAFRARLDRSGDVDGEGLGCGAGLVGGCRGAPWTG